MGIKRPLDKDGNSAPDKIAEDGASNSAGDKITEDEAALYDRQIRLWGMNCQKRLKEAKILVIGLNGVGAEVVKNLTLSGVNSISIHDDTQVTPEDTVANFFLCSYEPGQKRSEASVSAIQELNPNVKIEVVTGDIFSKPDDFFNGFSAIMATDCSVEVLIKLDNLCREHEIMFYCTDTWGFYGYCFLDLQIHKYKKLDKTTKKDRPKESLSSQVKEYCALSATLKVKVGEGLKKRVDKVFVLLHVMNRFRELFNRYPTPGSREDDVKELLKIKTDVCEKLGYDSSKLSEEMLSCVFGQLSPVCAVVGGIVANEIIKGLSRTGTPIHNYFFFDGNEYIGINEAICVS